MTPIFGKSADIVITSLISSNSAFSLPTWVTVQIHYLLYSELKWTTVFYCGLGHIHTAERHAKWSTEHPFLWECKWSGVKWSAKRESLILMEWGHFSFCKESLGYVQRCSIVYPCDLLLLRKPWKYLSGYRVSEIQAACYKYWQSGTHKQFLESFT